MAAFVIHPRYLWAPRHKQSLVRQLPLLLPCVGSLSILNVFWIVVCSAISCLELRNPWGVTMHCTSMLLSSAAFFVDFLGMSEVPSKPHAASKALLADCALKLLCLRVRLALPAKDLHSKLTRSSLKKDRTWTKRRISLLSPLHFYCP